MKEDKSNRYMIPPHYKGLLQPCDVGIIKPLKDRLKKAAANWKREQQKLLESGKTTKSETERYA